MRDLATDSANDQCWLLAELRPAECFGRAFTLLDKADTGHILHFIKGTVALQAADSLRATFPDKAESYARQAVNIFSAHPHRTEGPIATADWVSRTENARRGSTNQDEPTPQLYFIC